MQTFDLRYALENYPVCQKRTGRHKQFVFLTPTRVIKGPFKAYRVETIMRRKQFLQQWQTPLVVLPNDEQPIDPTLERDENTFLTYPNLAAGYPIETELCGETFSEYKYRVLKRTGLVKLSDAIKQKANENVIGAAVPDLIRALTHLYVLNVGDMHFANVLADLQKHTLHIVDFDENRSKDRDDEFFYLSKEPSREAAYILAKYGRPAAPGILQSLRILRETLTDPEYKARMDKALSLLSAYAQVPVPVAKGDTVPIIPVGGRTHEDYKKMTVTMLKTLLDERKLRKVGNKEDLIQRLLAYDTNPGGRAPGPKGQMYWNGLRGNSKTYSGYPLDVMKSALQKYIRRGILDKALMAATEIFRMAEVGGEAGQTGVINRLSVIAVEDIGPANIPLVTEVLDHLNKDIRDPALIFTIVQLLCESEKTRLPSHVRNGYGTERGRQAAVKRGLPVDNVEDIDHELLDYLALTDEEKGYKWKADDPEAIKDSFELFHKRLRERNVNAEAWLSRFFDASDGLKVQRRAHRSSPDIIIWEMLRSLIPAEIVEIYQKAYYKQTESGPFLMAIICGYLYGATFEQLDITGVVDVWRNSATLQQLLNGDYTLVLDDYVYDKHTAIGRSAGKTRADFVREGAVVNKQSAKFYDPVLHELYNSFDDA